MARTFDGTSAKITTSLGGLGVAYGACSMAAICRITDTTVSRRLVAIGTATTGTARHGFGYTSTGSLLDYRRGNAAAQSSTITMATADGWVLVAVTIAAGTNTARFHKFVFSTNTWTHENGSGTIADGTAGATSGYIGATNGGGGSFWHGDIEIGAVWNANLTDAQVESLPFNLPSWFAVQPLGLWLLDQGATAQKVLDLGGLGANESAITGTTVSTQSVPLFNRFDDAMAVTRQAPAGGTTYQKLGIVAAGTRAEGTDVFEAVEAGKVIAGTRASAADVFQAVEAGALITGTLVAGGKLHEVSDTGAVIAGTRASAADVSEFVEAGAVRTGALTAGTSQVPLPGKAGSVIAGTLIAAADVFEAAETGAIVAGTRASAADALEAAETGALIAGTVTRGSAQSGFVSKLGSLVVGTLTRAADVFTASRTGALVTRALTAAADVFTASETGSLRAGTRTAGTALKVSPVVYEKTGTLTAGTRLSSVAMHESAIPTGVIEGSSGVAGVVESASAMTLVEAATATFADVEGSTTTAGTVEGATLMMGMIE